MEEANGKEKEDDEVGNTCFTVMTCDGRRVGFKKGLVESKEKLPVSWCTYLQYPGVKNHGYY